MNIVASLKEAWNKFSSLRKKKNKPVDGVIFQEQQGTVDLLVADDFLVRMELFKEYSGGKKWGFELSAHNRALEACQEAVVSFNRKKGARFQDVPAEGLRIKSVEFSYEEMQANTMLVEVFVAKEKEKKKASFVVPLKEVFEKLKEIGKLSVVEEVDVEKEMERQKEAWKIAGMDASKGFSGQQLHEIAVPQLSAPQEVSVLSAIQDLENKIKDLEEQKQNVAKEFMKRTISYAEYAQLMSNISREIIVFKTQLDRAKKNEQ